MDVTSGLPMDLDGPLNKEVRMLAALLFENVGFQGAIYAVYEGASIPAIPPPMGSGDGQTSSMKVYNFTFWITFWESPNFNEGDDSLWIAPSGNGMFWPLDNLHTLRRPHGNNHWGDRIRAVSFSGPPTGSNENRTIIHPDGSVSVGGDLVRGSRLTPTSLESKLFPHSAGV